MPRLVLMVGLPGAGKTTRAKELERDLPALRLTPDDWILRILGPGAGRPAQDAVRDDVEAALTDLALRALALGVHVVLDFGFWSLAEREAMRARAAGLGSTELCFLDAPLVELERRVAARTGGMTIAPGEMERWAERFEPPTPDECRLREYKSA